MPPPPKKKHDCWLLTSPDYIFTNLSIGNCSLIHISTILAFDSFFVPRHFEERSLRNLFCKHPAGFLCMMAPGICTTDQDYLSPEHHSTNNWNLLALIPHSFLGNHDPTGAEKLASNIDISHASICPISPSWTCKTPAMELRHVTDQSWRFFPKAFGTTVRVLKKIEKKYWDIFSCNIFHILS